METPDEKPEIIEHITEKIVVGRDEIEFTFLYSPTGKDALKGRGRGCF